MKVTSSLLVLVSFLMSASPTDAQDVERGLRVFDCNFIVSGRPDFPGPDLTRFLGESTEETVAEEETPSPVLDPDLLVEMIQRNIQPDTWHNELNRISLRDGKLTVVQTPGVQEEISRFLRMLRRSRTRRIHLTAHALSVRLDHYHTFLRTAMARDRGILLSPEDLEHFQSPKTDADRIRSLASVSIAAYSGQVVHAGPVERTRFIRHLDTEIAEESTVVEPLVDDLLTGTVFTLKPTLMESDTVLLELILDSVRRLGEIQQVETGAGKVDLPMRSLQSTRTTVLVPVGHGVLLAASLAGQEGRVLVFLVVPRISDEDQTEDHKNSTKADRKPGRELRVYNTRLITTRIMDRPCPDPDETGDEEGGSIFGAAAEEGVGMGIEDLVEMIKDSIEEDTWANTRNSIRVVGELLVVVQKSGVHNKIVAFLKALRARRGVLVSTALQVLAVNAERLEALVGMEARNGTPLSEKRLRVLEEALDRGNDVQCLQTAVLTGFNRQRAHIQTAVERSVILGVNVEIAKKAAVTVPVIRALKTGLFLDVQPSLAGDGSHVNLDLFSRFTTASEPQLTKYLQGKDYAVHRYEKRVTGLFTSLFLPDGGTAVFLRGPVPGVPAQRLVVLVTTRIIRVKG